MLIERLGLAPDLVDFAVAWERQRAVHGEVVAGQREDTLLVCEHRAVYTAGARTRPSERPADGSDVVKVDRGGRITWHGPGQLVGYPILTLPNPVDVVAHVRRIEDVVIGVCADLGLAAGRVEGRSGVWVRGEGTRPDRKVCAIGVRVARGVTMHGFALNADCDLSWTEQIVPCGLEDATATSLTAELGCHVTVPEVAALVTERAHGLAAAAAATVAS